MRGGNNRGVYKLGKFDMVGRTFGRLKVLRRDEILTSHTGRSARWWCQCECGNEVSVRGTQLRNGRTQSCGCLQREQAAKANTRHGCARKGDKNPEYIAYYGAQQRCNNPNSPKYAYYGGCGIKFLYTSFQEFFADLGKRPSSKHSLDRIENNGNYEPGNCRWAVKAEQLRNRNTVLSLLISPHPQCDGSMTTPIDEIIAAHIRRNGKVMERL